MVSSHQLNAPTIGTFSQLGDTGATTSGFEIASTVLTLCQTQSVQTVILLSPHIAVPLRMLP